MKKGITCEVCGKSGWGERGYAIHWAKHHRADRIREVFPTKKEPKLGDRVWIKLPMNATVVRIGDNKELTLRTDDGAEWAYYFAAEVEVIEEEVVVNSEALKNDL